MDLAAKKQQVAPTLRAEAPQQAPEYGEEKPADCGDDTVAFPLHAAARPQLLAGRYRLDWVLAEGGMGIVYRGWHVALDQPIAIKMIRGEYSNNSEAVERFLREAQAMALLRGKHTPHVMDVARAEDGTPFMVLEFLEGKDLRQVMLEQAPLTIKRVVRWVVQAAEAVAEAHSQGLIHRDLKPDNLFLTVDPDGVEVVKVIDFGISKSLVKKSKFKTRSESCLGSPQYMSPEQIRSPRSVDARTDVWSLGVVLYELLTGHAPFSGTTLPAVCSAVLKLEPSDPRRLREDIPEGLAATIMRCLAKSVDQRLGSVGQLIHELSPYIRSEVPASQSAASGVRVTGGGVERLEDPSGLQPHSNPESGVVSAPRSFPLGAASLVFAGGLVCLAAAAAGTGRITLPITSRVEIAEEAAASAPHSKTISVAGPTLVESAAAAHSERALELEQDVPETLPVPAIEFDDLEAPAATVVKKITKQKPHKAQRRRARAVGSRTLPSPALPRREAKPESQLMEERYALTYTPAEAPMLPQSAHDLTGKGEVIETHRQLGKTGGSSNTTSE